MARLDPKCLTDHWRQLTARWMAERHDLMLSQSGRKQIFSNLYLSTPVGITAMMRNSQQLQSVSKFQSSPFPRTVKTFKDQKRGKLGMSTPFYGTFKKHGVSIWGGLFEDETLDHLQHEAALSSQLTHMICLRTTLSYRFVVLHFILCLCFYIYIFLFLLCFKSCICVALFEHHEHHNHEEFTACNCFSVIVAWYDGYRTNKWQISPHEVFTQIPQVPSMFGMPLSCFWS